MPLRPRDNRRNAASHSFQRGAGGTCENARRFHEFINVRPCADGDHRLPAEGFVRLSGNTADSFKLASAADDYKHGCGIFFSCFAHSRRKPSGAERRIAFQPADVQNDGLSRKRGKLRKHLSVLLRREFLRIYSVRNNGNVLLGEVIICRNIILYIGADGKAMLAPVRQSAE